MGKTELAKQLAYELFRDNISFIKLDMSEYSEPNAVAKLIGAPPGYIGYEKGGALTEKVRRRPYSIVLFDEIEKAHPDVISLLLQITDEGILTDSDGRSVNFKNTYIILTTNAGYCDRIKGAVGFLNGENGKNDLDEYFKPELLSRIGEIILFSPLSREVLREITIKALKDLSHRLASSRNIILKWDDDAINRIIGESGLVRSGARGINQAVDKQVENPIAKMIVSGKIEDGDHVNIKICDNEIVFKIEKSANTVLKPDALVK